MSRRVRETLHTIMGTGDHSPPTDNDSTNGDLSLVEGLLCLLQRQAHIALILGCIGHGLPISSSPKSIGALRSCSRSTSDMITERIQLERLAM